MKVAGKVVFEDAREMAMTRSSRGWRRASRTERGNSGISSRKRTPRWAREISPGVAFEPPPIMETEEAVWCGERKGRVATMSSVRLAIE